MFTGTLPDISTTSGRGLFIILLIYLIKHIKKSPPVWEQEDDREKPLVWLNQYYHYFTENTTKTNPKVGLVIKKLICLRKLITIK